MKSSAERSIEALTWASVVIWLGFMLVTGGLVYAWLVLMVLGIILLSSAIYQRSRGWDTSLAIWIFGIWMAVFSVIESVNAIIKGMNDGEGLSINLSVYLGIALVSMGVASVLRIVQGPHGAGIFGARGGAGYRAGQTGSAERTVLRGEAGERWPRVAQDDFSSANFPAQGPRVYQPDQDWQPTSRTHATERNAQGYFTPPGGSRYEDPQPSRVSRTGGYRYERAQFPQAPEPGSQHYDDLYDEQGWDAPPQTQRYAPPAPEPRRPRPDPAVDDLQARVEDIIRRSRERRNVSPDDLPY